MLDWKHRIDAVPETGRRVQIRARDGSEQPATVRQPQPGADEYSGMGDDVRFLTDRGMWLKPSRTVTHWAYLADDQVAETERTEEEAADDRYDQ